MPKQFTILVPSQDNPLVQVPVKFIAVEEKPGFYDCWVGSTYTGCFHTQMCGIILANEVVNAH